jgi:hypothetical protein
VGERYSLVWFTPLGCEDAAAAMAADLDKELAAGRV